MEIQDAALNLVEIKEFGKRCWPKQQLLGYVGAAVMRCFAQESRLGSNNSVLVETTTAEAAFSMTPHMDLLHFPLITAQFAVINGLISKNRLGWGLVMALCGLGDAGSHGNTTWSFQGLGAAVFDSRKK